MHMRNATDEDNDTSNFFTCLKPDSKQRNLEFGRKSLPNPKSLATFSLAPGRIRTQAVVRDRWQSVATP